MIEIQPEIQPETYTVKVMDAFLSCCVHNKLMLQQKKWNVPLPLLIGTARVVDESGANLMKLSPVPVPSSYLLHQSTT